MQAQVVSFDLAAFDVEAIKKAAYRFLDRFSIEISIEGGRALCSLSFIQPLTPVSAKRIVDDFRTEVLDQDLRTSNAKETAPMRNAILALAFSRTKLQGDE